MVVLSPAHTSRRYDTYLRNTANFCRAYQSCEVRTVRAVSSDITTRETLPFRVVSNRTIDLSDLRISFDRTESNASWGAAAHGPRGRDPGPASTGD